MRACIAAKNGNQLHQALTELEHELVSRGGDKEALKRIKIINNRATLFRIAADVMIKACNEFVAMTR